MKKILKNNTIPCVLVLLMLFSTYPYLFCYFLGFPSESIMIFAFLGIFLVYCLKTDALKYKIPHIGPIMLSQIVVWLMFFFLHGDSSYLVRVLLICETYLVLHVLLKKQATIQFANVYNWSLAIQGALGVVAFFLLFMGLISPIAQYDFSETRYEQCFLLTCSNTVAGNFMRVGGYFDEPGALAYWGVFALLINKLTYNNKKIEITLLISLLFTFSAAYFVILPIYLLCFYLKSVRKLLVILIISIPLLIWVYGYISDNEFVALYTTERFEGGTIRSSRFEQQEIAKKLFIQSPIIGHGAKNIQTNHGMAAENPYEILAKDGVVGFFFTYLPLFVLVAKYRKDKYAMYSIFILAVDYLQRPFHVNQMQYFMLYFIFCIVIIRNQKAKIVYA